jgi:hypothetical protein
MAKKHREYDNDYPSVTQVLDVLRKIGLEMWFKNNTPQFIKEESEKAKLIGTQLHDAIQSHIELNEIKVETQYPDEIANALKSFMLFKSECSQIKLHRAEVKMTSEMIRVNGTLDCVGDDGEPVIFDWKTGKAKDDLKPAIYDEYFYQVSAYVHIYNEVNKTDIKKAYILSLAKDKVAYNLEALDFTALKFGFDIFMNCLDIYNNKKRFAAYRKDK